MQNGSPVLQIYDGNLLAYDQFRDDPSEFLRYQSRLSLAKVRALYPVIVGLLRTAPSAAVAERARKLLERARLALENDSMLQAASRAVAGEVVGVALRRADRRAKNKAVETAWAPDMRVTRYRMNAVARLFAR
jgi:hypothetical protein